MWGVLRIKGEKKGSFFGFFRKKKKTCEIFDEISTKKIDPPTFVVGWKIHALKNVFFF